MARRGAVRNGEAGSSAGAGHGVVGAWSHGRGVAHPAQPPSLSSERMVRTAASPSLKSKASVPLKAASGRQTSAGSPKAAGLERILPAWGRSGAHPAAVPRGSLGPSQEPSPPTNAGQVIFSQLLARKA